MEFEDYDADDLDLQRKTVIKLRDQLNELIAEIENLSAEGQTGND
jgi:BMFP domain-containing protein YqiC